LAFDKETKNILDYYYQFSQALWRWFVLKNEIISVSLQPNRDVE